MPSCVVLGRNQLTVQLASATRPNLEFEQSDILGAEK